MSTFSIASIVEGHGEVDALPILVRRIGARIAGVESLNLPRPFRVPRDRLLKDDVLETTVVAVGKRLGDDPGGVLVLIDADDDCPAALGPELMERAQGALPRGKVVVVLANMEYEAWFLSCATSLAGHRNLPSDLREPADPESIRGTKEWLSRAMPSGKAYSSSVDQPALTARMDLDLARSRSGSFDKLWRALESLCS
ncbi:MAG: DUF4276 family protein [Acidimicrobiales bacterium]|jgi:hypothetical protein